MREQTEQKLSPIAELLLRQQQTMRQLLGNPEDRLRPLKEYAQSAASTRGA
jgi:hypothetical protein